MATSVNELYPLQLQLGPDRNEILDCGVLVGELRLANGGNVPLVIGGILSIDGHSGRLRFQLEQPDGEIRTLVKHSMADMHGWQRCTLQPGEFVVHPVCLLKLDGEYIFRGAGRYRIRAVYLTNFPEIIGAAGDTVHYPQPYAGYPSRVESEWVEIAVLTRGRGWDEYVESQKWSDLFRAFSDFYGWEQSQQWLGEIEDNLNGYGDYQHEQEKLLVYQQVSQGMFKLLFRTQEYNEELLGDAKNSLNRANRFGIGISMWEWIVGRLEGFAHPDGKREVSIPASGYYF